MTMIDWSSNLTLICWYYFLSTPMEKVLRILSTLPPLIELTCKLRTLCPSFTQLFYNWMPACPTIDTSLISISFNPEEANLQNFLCECSTFLTPCNLHWVQDERTCFPPLLPSRSDVYGLSTQAYLLKNKVLGQRKQVAAVSSHDIVPTNLAMNRFENKRVYL